MITMYELVAGYIESKEGSSVSQQFLDTAQEGESFEDQNTNALKYIGKRVKMVLDSELFNDSDAQDLETYLEELNHYLNSDKDED